MIDLSGATWRKASGSPHNGGCVEVAGNLPGVAAVRDSERPEAGALVIDQAVFAAFLAEVRYGPLRPRMLRPQTPGPASVSSSEIHDMT
jgi:hypothetical protein